MFMNFFKRKLDIFCVITWNCVFPAQVEVKEDFSGAQPATLEPKPGKKKLKKLKKEERDKTKGKANCYS